MALRYADRVFETTSNKPTASQAYDLAGALAGYQTFVAGIGDANTCVYCAQQVDGQGAANGAWEIGVGTVTDAAPDTLARTALIASSSGALIDWSATGVDNSPSIFVTTPAAYFGSRGGYGPAGESGRWFGPYTGAALTTMGLPLNQVRVVLVSWPVGVPINDIGIEITGSLGGGFFRVGVYEDAGGVPGTLLFNSAKTADTVAVHTFNISPAVYPKTPWLWLAFVSDSGPTIRGRTATNKLYAAMLGQPSAGSTAIHGGLYVTDANAVKNGLPDPFGAPTYPSDSQLPEVRIKT